MSEGFLSTAKEVGYYITGPTPKVFTLDGYTPDAFIRYHYRHTWHYNPRATATLNVIWQAQERKYQQQREELKAADV